ncbi:MAG: hypothetical protein K0Q59_1492 [Paenibacillus sp.]|nr:hypothetical protein [Paenibacillus sp.]
MHTKSISTIGKHWKMAVLFPVVLASAACGGANDGASGETGGGGTAAPATAPTPPAEMKPVELSVLDANGGLTQDSFMKSYGQYIQRKYPNISFKVLEGGGAKVPEYAAAKAEVDLISSNMNGYGTATLYGYGGFDISALAKTHGFDLSRVNPAMLDGLKKMNGGKPPGLPMGVNYQVTFYNKDLFDKFGEKYPTDGMTWDQMYELARKMSRTDGGIRYGGLSIWGHERIFNVNQFGEELLDHTTGKALFNSSTSKLPRLFQQVVKFAEIPGNEFAINDPTAARDAFTKEGRMAMMIALRSQFNATPVAGTLDLVTYPTFPDLPGIGSAAETSYYTISSTSKHAEEAFLALTSLYDDQVQLEKVKAGNYPMIPVAGWEKLYYSESDVFKGKNINAFIQNKFPPAVIMDSEASAVNTELYTAFRSVAKKETDMNTAMRAAEERANKKVEEMRAAKK